MLKIKATIFSVLPLILLLSSEPSHATNDFLRRRASDKNTMIEDLSSRGGNDNLPKPKLLYEDETFLMKKKLAGEHKKGVNSNANIHRLQQWLPSEFFPFCNAPNPQWIGDGYCDKSDDYNNAACQYDGGDCCEETCVSNTHTCGVVGYDCKLETLTFPPLGEDDEILDFP